MGARKRAGQPAQGLMAIGRVAEPGVYPTKKGVLPPAPREELVEKDKERFSGRDKTPGGTRRPALAGGAGAC